MRVFYSWQSDLPNRTNRSFIESALDKAAKEVSRDEIAIEVRIDSDTVDVPGSPNIAETIFEKIEASDVFVADVSIINQTGGKPTPNPNVLVELGFAASELGWENVVVVSNVAYGRIEDLPFDIRSRRVLPYKVDDSASEQLRAEEKRSLSKQLARRIRDIRARLDAERRQQQPRVAVAWQAAGQASNTVTIKDAPDLRDFEYAIPRRVDDEEMEYLQKESPDDAEAAKKYNAAAETALADQALREQWLQSMKRGRYDRGTVVDLQIATGDEDVRDLLVTLTFPAELEVFENEDRPDAMEGPKLPQFPKLGIVEKQKRQTRTVFDNLMGTYSSGLDLLGARAVALPSTALRVRSIRDTTSLVVRGSDVKVHIQQMSRRRTQLFKGSSAIRIAALGAPGEYKVQWHADGEAFDEAVCGELTVVVDADKGAALHHGARDYIGPPLESQIVEVEEL